MPEPPAVALAGVGRVYESGPSQVWALRDVDLTIPAGETLAVTGPSGSGKTTLLNLIAGLDRPSHGTIAVLGQPLADLDQFELAAFRARHLGLVFQDPHLLPGLTALENLVAARLPWRRRGQLVAESRELLEAVGLAERVDFPPARLSGGERQRVAVARALLGGPSLLLADEPTGNLDAAMTDDLMGLFERLRSERGLAIVFATHDPAVASFADRNVRLRDGRVAADRLLGAVDAPLERHALE